ncbi:hypothetical protein CsSME_00036538 [Camellia sinensis var. sinensis]
MTRTTGSGSPPSSSSAPLRRSRSRFRQSSSSLQRRQRSWSPRSASSSPSGGRRSRSRSWSPVASSSRPPIVPLPISSEATTAAVEETKALYMFFIYSSGPINYCLYAINMPNLVLPLPPLQPCNQFRELEKTIYPILEFPFGEYPEFMCCIELDMKLYFFGGRLSCRAERQRSKGKDWDLNDTYPPDVHVLDTTTISTNTIVTSNRPSELLRKGTAMICGKPNPYAFVAHKKIYAIATGMRFDYKSMNLSRFEVFDLDSNKWSILPDPPTNKKLIGHALVDRRVFILTLENEIFSFNVDTCVWVRFSKYRRVLSYFDRSAVFVEDTLYSIYNYTVAAFGPTSESEPEAKAKGLFDRMALLSSDVGDAIEHNLQVTCPSAYLVHLGNRIFYYVSTGSLPDPKIPDHLYSEDTERRKISIITFEVLRETYTESSNEGDKTFVQSKLLRTAEFVARSKCGAIVDIGFLLGCFLISTSAM